MDTRSMDESLNWPPRVMHPVRDLVLVLAPDQEDDQDRGHEIAEGLAQDQDLDRDQEIEDVLLEKDEETLGPGQSQDPQSKSDNCFKV